MRNVEELQRDVDQFDFRVVRQTTVRKKSDDTLSVVHSPPDYARQRKEASRFAAFVEKNWTVREIEFAAGFHPAGTFHPHEDEEARITRTKIENAVDECFVEEREPTEVNYAGFGFSTWAEAEAFDKTLQQLQREALMLLGACAALELHGTDFQYGIFKDSLDPAKDSAFNMTIAQLRREVVEAVRTRP